jgi:hypothetical protein
MKVVITGASSRPSMRTTWRARFDRRCTGMSAVGSTWPRIPSSTPTCSRSSSALGRSPCERERFAAWSACPTGYIFSRRARDFST